jgi:hypothetical protein
VIATGRRWPTKSGYRWVAVYFSTLGGGNPDDQVAALLTTLFDAMMTTFRWAQEVQGEPA